MCIKTRLDFQRMAASWYPRSTNSRLPPTTPCLAERRWSHVASASTPSTSRERETRDELYKIGLPGKSILRDYFQENRTSRRPFLLLRISFPGRPIFIQLPPANKSGMRTCIHSGFWSLKLVLVLSLIVATFVVPISHLVSERLLYMQE